MKETTVLSLSYGQVIVKPKEKLHGLVPGSFETYQVVDPGAIIVRPTDLQNDRNSLRFALSHDRGIITSAYLCFHTTDELVREYGYFLLHAYDLQKIFYGLGSGLRQNLDWQDFRYLPCLVPPLEEQHTIVQFLYRADRRIRRLIRAKQKLITLLEEQKQAIIHRAVTRGLDPNVRLKPSGVEWLGDIPEHWEVVPLKFLSKRVQNGATPPTSESAFYQNGTVPWYGPSSCAQGDNVGPSVRHLAEAAFTSGHARLVHHPALLVVVIGATAGRMALLLHDGATNQQITSYQFKAERVVPRFVLYQIRGAERWLRSTASTATIPILDAGEVSRLPVAVTSLDEQTSIVHHTDESTVDLTRAIDQARREISLLREYRTRLIADVVTGKVDVRAAAAALPDEAESGEDEDVILESGEEERTEEAPAEETEE